MSCSENARRAGRALPGLVLLAALAAACGDPAAGGGSPDAGLADGGPDGGDAGVPDAGAPLRQLTTRPLFGAMPLDNRVLDPDLGASGWFAFTDSRNYWARVSPEAWSDSPTGQGSLRMDPLSAAVDQVVVGMARGGPGPLEVSVWLGYEKDRMETPRTVSFTGFLETDARDRSVDLAPGTAPEDLRVAGSRVWQRWTARLDTGVVGWAALTIVDQPRTGPLRITGPVVRVVEAPAAETLRADAPGRAGSRLGPPAAAPRDPDAQEREGLARMRERMRRTAVGAEPLRRDRLRERLGRGPEEAVVPGG